MFKADEELLKKIKQIQFKAKHLVSETFSGEYESAFRGRGMEFDEIRPYLAGDDVRSIDWNVTARMGRPHVKIYRDERELTVLFVVDVSGSMRFGSNEKLKMELAAEISALLAYAALKGGDKVGLLIFAGGIEHYIPPRKGRGHIYGIIKDILSFRPEERQTHESTDIEGATRFMRQVLKHRSIVFFISDFLMSDYQLPLSYLGRAHDLVCINLMDRREQRIPKMGYVEFVDAETKEVFLVNTSDTKWRSSFEESMKERLNQLTRFFQSRKIDSIFLENHQHYVDEIVRFFRRREKRRGR